MTTSLLISIPVELANFAVTQRWLVRKYQTNAVIRALDTWLVLKAETDAGYIQSWNKQKSHLLRICKVTETVFRSRLRMLQTMDLIKYDRHSIRLCSWEHMGKLCEIDIKEKNIVQYELSNNQRVQEWIIATEIKENKARQAYMIMKKVNKNPVYKVSLIAAMLKAGADRARINDASYFISWLNILYRQDFQSVSDIHDILIEIRPDTNRGVAKMASTWCAKHKTTVSYWKKVLFKSKIIDIGKLQIVSHERARNSACTVKWVRKLKQTMLCLVDSITILEPYVQTICKDNAYNKDIAIENLSAE